jgi:hypothetical protein
LAGVTPSSSYAAWFVGTALLTGLAWVLCYGAGLNTWWSAAISFTVGELRDLGLRVENPSKGAKG